MKTKLPDQNNAAGGCLIVDDDPQMLALIRDVVEAATGWRTTCFDNGDDALAAFESAPWEFDTVFTDWNMPGMDGIELGRRIRARAPGVKLVLVTANAFLLDERAAFLAGFSRIIAKPFHLDALHEALDGAVSDTGRDLPLLNNFHAHRRQTLNTAARDFSQQQTASRGAGNLTKPKNMNTKNKNRIAILTAALLAAGLPAHAATGGNGGQNKQQPPRPVGGLQIQMQVARIHVPAALPDPTPETSGTESHTPPPPGVPVGASVANLSPEEVVIGFESAAAAERHIAFRLIDADGAVAWDSNGDITEAAPADATLHKKECWKRLAVIPLIVNGEALPTGLYTVEAVVGAGRFVTASATIEIVPNDGSLPPPPPPPASNTGDNNPPTQPPTSGAGESNPPPPPPKTGDGNSTSTGGTGSGTVKPPTDSGGSTGNPPSNSGTGTPPPPKGSGGSTPPPPPPPPKGGSEGGSTPLPPKTGVPKPVGQL